MEGVQRERRCAEGCAGGARAWAEWAGGAGVVGAGPVQRKSKVKNFRKIFKSVPVLTGLTMKNRLSVNEGRVVVVAQGQGMGGGCAS